MFEAIVVLLTLGFVYYLYQDGAIKVHIRVNDRDIINNTKE